MMKRILFSLLLAGCCVPAFSHTFVWGSADVRYMKNDRPAACPVPDLRAWKGERVNAQAVFVPDADAELSAAAGDLRCGNVVIPSSCIQCSFVDYVIADYYGSRGENVSLQPDRLVPGKSHKVAAGETSPLWVSVQVPSGAKEGTYRGKISVSSNGKKFSLPLSVKVLGRTLPAPEKWAFHLDLWQNPYAVARWFDVPLWSDEHFDRLRPIMEKYASAGGKVITASIIQHPWNSQTFDPFESMVVKTRKVDGGWSYSYSVFDRWVEFMLSCGVTEQIDCYTIVPWGYKFDYFDEATATVKYIESKPGEKEYEDYILPFLTDFAVHLKEKGWFGRTCIAMDERPVDQMKAARAVVHKADPGFRIAGAVNYSPEAVDIMHDISVMFNYSDMPEDVLVKRTADGRYSTIYTCCAPEHPNTFTFSPYAESEYIGLSAAARFFDGYLRWALNSWPGNPCEDSRFGKWLSGDTYLLYPEGSSVRFERLIEGIQDYEKIRILRSEGNPSVLSELDAILMPFRTVVCDGSINAAEVVRKAKSELNRL